MDVDNTLTTGATETATRRPNLQLHQTCCWTHFCPPLPHNFYHYFLPRLFQLPQTIKVDKNELNIQFFIIIYR